MSNTPHYVLKIQYVNKPAETRNFEAPVVTLGREAGDIALNDPQSSGRHAEIHFQNGAIQVKDLGSTNGTYFNGQRTPQFNLGPGQAFSIGQTVITLLAVHGAAPKGQAKTMIAMGPPPPAPGGRPGGPPPPGRPPGPPAGARPGGPPPGGPMGGPPPGGPMGGPPPGGPMGGPPPGGPMGGPPPGGPMGGPPPGGPMGGPPPGGPMGGPPPGGPMGGPPRGGPGGPPPGGPMGGPPPGGPMGGPPPGGPMGGPPPGGPGGMPVPVPAGAQPAFGGPGPMAGPGGSMGGGGIRPTFTGTGGEIFGQLFVGGLLVAITFGIYMPWFACKLINYVFSKTTVTGTPKGSLRMSFSGKGGELFVLYLVGYLLTMITFGIYSPWSVAKLLRWTYDNTNFTADDGTQYKLRFDATGGDLLVTFLVGGFLTVITFYIYMPWFICKVNKLIATKTVIIENGQPVGSLDYVGEGGKLFGTLIVGAILSAITLYIYMPWFMVKVNSFHAEHTRINVKGKSFKLGFGGTGGELFVIGLVGYLLTLVTFGIYSFWFIAKLMTFWINNLSVHDAGAAPQMAMPPGPGMQQPGLPPQGQPMQAGLPPQGGMPPQGMPPQGGYPPQGGMPPQGGGYPPQGGGY